MKKIVILLVFTLFLLSCSVNNKEVEKTIKKFNNENIEKKQINKIKKFNIKEIDKNDIRKKTEYIINFTWIQDMYYNKPENLSLLLTYINNLKYQWFIEKKEKDYAKIIIDLWMNYIDNIENNNIQLNKYWKTVSFSMLLQNIGNSFELLWKTDRAIEYYNKSANTNKKNYKSYLYISHLYLKLWKKEMSSFYIQKAIMVIKDSKLIDKNNNLIQIIWINDYYWGYLELWIIYKILWNKKESEKNFIKVEEIMKKSTFSNNYEKNKTLIEIELIKNTF